MKKITEFNESKEIVKKENGIINKAKTALKIIESILPPIPYLSTPIKIISAVAEYDEKVYQDQLNEYIEFIKNNKDEFVLSAIDTPQFANIFMQLTAKFLFEIYEEKRKLILNYIKNLGKGINEDFINHTKALRVLDLILPEEVATFYLWQDELTDYKAYSKMTEEAKKKRGEFMNIRNILERVNKKGFNLTEGDMYFIVKSLSSYGLLGVKEETPTQWGGGQAELKIAGITKFGEDFLKFISY